MNLHARLTPVGGAVRQQISGTALRVAQGSLLHRHQPAHFNRHVALSEVGKRIVIGVLPAYFVCGSALQVQLQLALLRFGNYNRILCQRQPGATFFAHFREEHPVPLRSARGNVVDVQHGLGKTLVENAWLHLKRRL